MKNIILFALTCMTLILSSCSDFLNQPQRGKENLDDYFLTEEQNMSFVTGCYHAITMGDWWQTQRLWILSDMTTDDAWMGNTEQSQEAYLPVAHFQATAQSCISLSEFWKYRYRGILRCNIAIDRIPKTNVQNKVLRDRLVAEARFLRAYFYFELVRNFGGVPIMKEMLMPDELENVMRNSVDEVYNFIEEDLKLAASILPESYDVLNTGRITSGAANGLLMKVYVYQKKWKEAASIYDNVFSNTTQYELVDLSQIWSMDHNNNKESLFEVQFMYNETYPTGSSLSIVTLSRSDGGWGWCVPTSDLENAFTKEDQRKDWTIIKSGNPVKGLESEYPNYTIAQISNKSGRTNRKFFVPASKRPNENKPRYFSLNHRILRFADILLLQAEAQFELGNENAARESVNRVRSRAGLKDLPGSVSGIALRDAIRLERRLELALEHNRLYDLRRWDDENGKKAISNIMGPNGSFVKYNTGPKADEWEMNNSRESNSKGITFNENRDLLYPLPLYEITTSNGSIQQNPGW